MPDLPSFSDLFRVARDEILARNSKLSRDAVEREGMDANILLAGACAAADEVIGQLTVLSAGLFLDSAQKTALDRLLFDRYGLVRKPAAAAIGSVQFSNPTAVPVTFTIPVNTYLSTADGKQFVTTESTIFNAGSAGPLTVAVRSVLAGADQNVKAGTITNIITTISSAPSGFAVTNALATAGADDAELDPAFRERGRRFFTTARRGTIAAIEAAALGVSGVRSATAFEVVDAIGRPARLVQLVVADAFTEQFANITGVLPATYQVQSQGLAASVFAGLADVRPAGVFVQVIVANVVLQAIQLALTFNAGADVNSVALQARAAAVNYVNGLAPGAAFVPGDLLAKFQAISGLLYTGSELVSPLGAISAKPTQVIRTSLGLVSALASQTNQPIITGSNPDAYTLA
jgi:hypothetical protein